MRILIIWILTFFLFMELNSQSRFEVNVTDCYVLQGVQLIATPESKPVKTNILIKDGLISLIGSRIPYPSNAEVMDLDSMFVYAGFIAPVSHIGIKQEKKEEEQERIRDPGNPPNEKAGITPELSVFGLIDAKDKYITEWRSAGFTTAHVVPVGGMFPGQSAIINLGGDSPDEMLLRADAAMFSQLKGARRMYPSTIIGVLAKWKDMYRKAIYAQQHEQTYSRHTSGTPRPEYDRSIKALYPVINKEQAVYLSAQKTLDISRAISLQKELGFNMVLCDVKQVWPNIPAIKSGGYTLLLSLDLPEKMEKEEESEEMVESEENNALKERKEKSVEAYRQQAALLENEGIPFSFSYLDVKADKVRENVAIMIENGMSEQKALEALTTFPAKLLGIEDICGTVETGKMANLVITDKPVFKKDAQIKYVFVDGKAYTMKTKAKAKRKAGKKDMISGLWYYTLATPIGERKGRFKFTLEDDVYSAFISAEENPEDMTEVDDLEVDGEKVHFRFTTDVNGMSVTFDVSFSIDEDALEGSFSNEMFGAMPLNGSRLQDPK